MQLFKDIASLIYYQVVNGEAVETKLEIFVNKKSVARQEFYASYQIGVTPTCIFEMRIEDFELTKTIEEGTNKPLYATRILYDGAIYDIIRTYEKSGMIEITCS